MRRVIVLGIALIVMYKSSLAETPRVPLYSVWEGSYVCTQGITAVRLTIETSSTGAAMGKFEFGPHPNNRSVPNGRYWMTGTLHTTETGALELRLVPDRWAERPAGYVMVGLHATSDLELRSLEGDIDHRGCGKISVRRVVEKKT